MECVTLDTLGAKAPFSKTEPDSFVSFNNYFTKEQKSKLAKEEKLANLRKTRAIQKKIISLLPVVHAVVVFSCLKLKKI